MNRKRMLELEQKLGEKDAAEARERIYTNLLDLADQYRSDVSLQTSDGARWASEYMAHFIESIVKFHPDWTATDIVRLLAITPNPAGFIRQLTNDKVQKELERIEHGAQKSV